MNLIKKAILLLVVGLSQAYGLSTLRVVNNTVGLLKPVITRQGNDAFFTAKADSNAEFKQDNLLDSGDQIDFKSAGNSWGPLLSPVLVETIGGRTANVTIICTPDQCTVEQF